MSERWTDKKRGYGGGVSPDAKRLSAIAGRLEDLGSLSIKKSTSEGPDGTTIVKRFGMYERQKYYPTAVVEQERIKERSYLIVNRVEVIGSGASIHYKLKQWLINCKQNSYDILSTYEDYTYNFMPLQHPPYPSIDYRRFRVMWSKANRKFVYPLAWIEVGGGTEHLALLTMDINGTSSVQNIADYPFMEAGSYLPYELNITTGNTYRNKSDDMWFTMQCLLSAGGFTPYDGTSLGFALNQSNPGLAQFLQGITSKGQGVYYDDRTNVPGFGYQKLMPCMAEENGNVIYIVHTEFDSTTSEVDQIHPTKSELRLCKGNNTADYKILVTSATEHGLGGLCYLNHLDAIAYVDYVISIIAYIGDPESPFPVFGWANSIKVIDLKGNYMYGINPPGMEVSGGGTYEATMAEARGLPDGLV